MAPRRATRDVTGVRPHAPHEGAPVSGTQFDVVILGGGSGGYAARCAPPSSACPSR